MEPDRCPLRYGLAKRIASFDPIIIEEVEVLGKGKCLDGRSLGKIKSEVHPRPNGGSPISTPHAIHNPRMDSIGVPSDAV